MEGKAAVKLLPAYVKQGRLEEKVVLTAIGKDTLEDAFKYLKENLDPDEDEFEAAAKFRRMTWTPGEPAPVMDRAFEKTPHCESYVDDILVFSLTLESHLDHLRDVFIALEGRLAATQI